METTNKSAGLSEIGQFFAWMIGIIIAALLACGLFLLAVLAHSRIKVHELRDISELQVRTVTNQLTLQPVFVGLNLTSQWVYSHAVRDGSNLNAVAVRPYVANGNMGLEWTTNRMQVDAPGTGDELQ